MADALRRGLGTLLISTLVMIALTAALTAWIAPMYESQARVQILDPDASGGLLQELGPLGALALPGLGDSEIDTDISVIRSRRIVEEVVDSLALHVDLLNPEEPRSEVVLLTGPSGSAVPARYTFRGTGEGTYRLHSARVRRADGEYTRSDVEVAAIARPPELIVPGQPFELGGLTLTLIPPASGSTEIELRVRPFQEFVQRVQERSLRVRRPDRGQVLLLDFRHRDAELAAAAVNAISDNFLEYKLSTSGAESRSRVAVLQEQVATYEGQIRDVERQLQRYQEQELIVAPEEQATQQVRRVAELQVGRDAAVVERQAMSAILSEIERGEGSGTESPYRRLATFPSFIANGAIQDLLQALIEVEDTRAELLVRRQPGNADVRALTERIEELELQLLRLAQNYIGSLDSQIASAESSLARFAGELATMPAREIEFARLTRERMLLTEVYLTLQQRLKEAEVLAAIAAATGSVRILDEGLEPEKPVFPNAPVNIGLGAILGMLIGVMVIVARESAGSRIRSRADALEMGINLPLLATIPRASTARLNGSGGSRWAVARRLTRNGRSADVGTALVTRASPASGVADAFRGLRANILYARPQTTAQVLLLTSATHGDGKSFSASNLAVSLAQHGARTLLIDADLRGGRLHEAMGLPGSPGLADVLRRRTTIVDVLRRIEVGTAGSHLEFIPNGGAAVDDSEFLAAVPAEELIEQLRANYDWIVLDAPTVEALADAALLGRIADLTIVVARSGGTEREALAEAVNQLRRLGVNVGGLVLTEV